MVLVGASQGCREDAEDLARDRPAAYTAGQ